jgi:ribosome assembly protein YihI (activator of Der GTPase)
MAGESDSPPPNPIQRAADYQANTLTAMPRLVAAHRRLIASHDTMVGRLLDIANHGTKDDAVSLSATRDALDRIDRYYEMLGTSQAEDRAVTADELAEAMDIAKRLKK